MTADDFLRRLKDRFGDGIQETDLNALDPWVAVRPDTLVDLCRYLKGESDLAFNFLNCITAIDYFIADPKKAAKAGFEPHLELVYHLSSIRHKHTLVLKVKLPRWQNDEPGQPTEIPSVASVWRTADWHERETFDLSGVNFVGHPDLRRILLPEDWEGFPLRKDYEMPLEYHGIRGR